MSLCLNEEKKREREDHIQPGAPLPPSAKQSLATHTLASDALVDPVMDDSSHSDLLRPASRPASQKGRWEVVKEHAAACSSNLLQR